RHQAVVAANTAPSSMPYSPGPLDNQQFVNAPAPPPEVLRPRLPKEKQDKVDTSVSKGVAWLLQRQKPDGTWPINNCLLGTTALGGLTLLEAGVGPDEDAIKRAAEYVRSKAPNYGGGPGQPGDRTATYELSLSLLFLDRLGKIEDKALIRSIALRLIA